MDGKQRLLVVIFLLFCGLPVWVVTPAAQEKEQPPKQAVPPLDIQFTNQMSLSQNDFNWSHTYYSSYRRTKEVPYLHLAAEFCLKTINRLSDILSVVSRTTKFYNMADEKRLQACRFYTKLQRQSFLLKPKHHLRGSGNACQ